MPTIVQPIDYWDSTGTANTASISSAFVSLANAWGVSSGTAGIPDQFLATDGTRVADDVVLTNVIGFDVKAWDPGAGSARFRILLRVSR